jgi:thiamine-phosphate diphosphorylase
MLPERRPILCLVTDRTRLCPSCDGRQAQRCLVAQVRAAVEAGVDLVQIRERDLEAASLAAIVAEGTRIARGTGTRIVVNDRLDVAIAAGADGVHLRAESIPVAAARTAAPRGFLVGRSVHDVNEATRAADADYLIAGTVFSSSSKAEGRQLLGESGLAAIAGAVQVPVLAIGGITIEHLPAIAAAEAAGIAAIGLFLGGGADGECRSVPLGTLVEAARAGFDTMKAAS